MMHNAPTPAAAIEDVLRTFGPPLRESRYHATAAIFRSPEGAALARAFRCVQTGTDAPPGYDMVTFAALVGFLCLGRDTTRPAALPGGAVLLEEVAALGAMMAELSPSRVVWGALRLADCGAATSATQIVGDQERVVLTPTPAYFTFGNLPGV